MHGKEHPFWSLPGAGPLPVSPKVDFPALDHAVFDLWREKSVFARTISEREGKPDFVAYDGPPGTNGAPHIGHMMQSALKDLWPRYKTMQGFRVLRKAGWDTHGLPIELTAEKELGLRSKRDIAEFGVEKYIDYCRSTVFRYKKSWEEAIHRIGRFLDTDDAYATLTTDYIQTDWWVLKQAWDKGLLYRDRRIMPYCSRCGTSLSQHETAQGYKDVQDISLYAKFKVVGKENTYFVAWTTTPWTLLSNVALAVNADLPYVTVEIASGDKFIFAESRLDALKEMFGGHRVIRSQKGIEFLNGNYEPLWPFQKKTSSSVHVVIADDYVTADDGTGIVHLALYGADDFRLIRKNNLPEVQNVDLDGICTPSSGAYAGRWFREEGLDVDILKDLAGRGLLFGKEKITHSYPHCYRCDTPLMFFAKSGWFLRTSALKENMLAANRDVNWFPRHIKEGRFGNWLENNVDWNISRDRYWGSPLPIWTCECGNQICVESLADLENHHGSPLPDGFDPHKPYIDKLEIKCSLCGRLMKREPEVLDCWFNAGIMPWGQWGYPAKPGSEQVFENQFPADFICEAIDQTRGWFYTMLATSTLITATKERVGQAAEPDGAEERVDQAAEPDGNATRSAARPTRFSGGVSSFKNVICTEFITDREGRKMSKSKGNVVDPVAHCDRYGADAIRWNIYTLNPWTARRFKEEDLAESLKQALIPYWNAYSFFVTYARVDGWKPDSDERDARPASANPLDRWILSRLVNLSEEVKGSLDSYDVARAAAGFTLFLDELTNWFIRRSRRRFWKSEDDGDKQGAYRALYYVLTNLNRMLAPFIPFTSEAIYQNLERAYDASLPDSVHLAEWPQVDASLRDVELERKMAVVRDVVSLARSLRADNSVRVRQPLGELAAAGLPPDVAGEFGEIILDELNIKSLRLATDASELFKWKAKGDFKTLGPKFGSRVKEVAAAVANLTHDQIVLLLAEGELALGGDIIAKGDLMLSQEPAEGYWVRSEGGITVAIANRITPGLTAEWLAREFVHHVQNLRKEADLQVTDRIAVAYFAGEAVRNAVAANLDYIKLETLAGSVTLTDPGPEGEDLKIGDQPGRIWIEAIKSGG